MIIEIDGLALSEIKPQPSEIKALIEIQGSYFRGSIDLEQKNITIEIEGEDLYRVKPMGSDSLEIELELSSKSVVLNSKGVAERIVIDALLGPTIIESGIFKHLGIELDVLPGARFTTVVSGGIKGDPGPQGPAGPPGASGESAQRLEKNFTALEIMSALKLVKADSPGTMVKGFNNGDYEDAKILGVSLNALLAGNIGPVLLFGLLEDPFFNFPINSPLYLGLDGEITLTPPASGVYTVVVGKGLGPGAIFIDIQEPILT